MRIIENAFLVFLSLGIILAAILLPLRTGNVYIDSVILIPIGTCFLGALFLLLVWWLGPPPGTMWTD